MTLEINFDGLIGPTHNYAGLSLGNVASATNVGEVSRPRAAALQGIKKMRLLMSLGIRQGFLLPHERPHAAWLRQFGFSGSDADVCAAAFAADPQLFKNAISASAMWTANAGTVSPAADTTDGRVHITAANLSTMAHRSIEHVETHRQLTMIFTDHRHFAVHAAVPGKFGDEGAANFMRLCRSHAEPGVEVFVYGRDQGGRFPARQDRRASEAVARLNTVRDAIFWPQADAAIQAGAFHNDVVAVANERVLFAHEQAFDDRHGLYDAIRAKLPELEVVEVPASAVSLDDAIASYLFNSQLVTLPTGEMVLILPTESEQNARVKAWLDAMLASNGPIRTCHFIDVRESMRNGGGPACLRLRVAVSEAAAAAIDPRFLLDAAKADRLERLVETHWPEAIGPDDLGNAALWEQAWAARRALMMTLGLDT
jgi:succinylarginine dihydrolase